MTDKKTEALRLADELDWRHQDMPICPEREAAAELRRLHAELEAMTQCAKNHDASRTKYLLLNAELLEALKLITQVGDRAATEIARAAIRARKENT